MGGKYYGSKCPECGSSRTARIVYGYPSPELIEQASRGEVVLGGCVIWPEQPVRACLACGHEWPGKRLDNGDDADLDGNSS